MAEGNAENLIPFPRPKREEPKPEPSLGRKLEELRHIQLQAGYSTAIDQEIQELEERIRAGEN